MEQEQQITVRRRVEFIGIGPHFFVRLLVCLALGGFLVWKRALLLGDGWAAPAMRVDFGWHWSFCSSSACIGGRRGGNFGQIAPLW